RAYLAVALVYREGNERVDPGRREKEDARRGEQEAERDAGEGLHVLGVDRGERLHPGELQQRVDAEGGAAETRPGLSRRPPAQVDEERVGARRAGGRWVIHPRAWET